MKPQAATASRTSNRVTPGPPRSAAKPNHASRWPAGCEQSPFGSRRAWPRSPKRYLPYCHFLNEADFEAVLTGHITSPAGRDAAAPLPDDAGPGRGRFRAGQPWRW